MSFKDIAGHLQIVASTAHCIFKRFEDTGNVSPLKQPTREVSQKLDDLHELFILAMVVETPCMYLREICQTICNATGV